MTFQNPSANLSEDELELALTLQKEAFEYANIYTGNRGSLLLGHKNRSLIQQYRKGERLITSPYALRLGRLGWWRDMGYDLRILYSVDWLGSDVALKKGQSKREQEDLAKILAGMISRGISLNPFKLTWRKNIDAEIAGMEKEVAADHWEGKTLALPMVIAALSVAKPGYRGRVEIYECERTLKEKYPTANLRASLRQVKPPRGIWSGASQLGIWLGPLPEPVPEPPPAIKTLPPPDTGGIDLPRWAIDGGMGVAR